MRSTTVRGTPINSMKAGNTEGQMARKPAGMNGTVNRQFEGDQKGNDQVRGQMEGKGRLGTEYTSQGGNGPETMRVRSHDRYGMVRDENGDQNNPKDNGNGVLFDGVMENHGMRPGNQPQTMDSPVPEGAQRPISNAPHILNNLRSGEGEYYGAGDGPPNHFNGVMTRGMEGTSTPKGSIFELTEDDVLRNEGRGGAIG